MSAVAGAAGDLSTRRQYHRAPMPPPDDRQRVLVVEDEPNIASFARMYLEAAGFEVSLAARGDDGLEDGRGGGAAPGHPRSCRGSTGTRSPSACGRGRRRSSCSRRGTTRSTRWSASSSARTTTSPSRSIRASWSRVRALRRAERPGVDRPAPAGDHRARRPAHRGRGREVFVDGDGVRADAEGVRSPVTLIENRAWC